jgi:hypothetical protein
MKITRPGEWIVNFMEKKGWYEQDLLPKKLFLNLCEEDRKKVLEEDRKLSIIGWTINFYLIVFITFLIIAKILVLK